MKTDSLQLFASPTVPRPRATPEVLGVMRWVRAGILLCFALAPASAQTTSVLSVGSGRGYDSPGMIEVVMTGTSMTTVRSALAADGFQFIPSESFTAVDLAGYPIVFLGLFDPVEALSAEERAAIQSFVRDGGALIFLADNERFATPNASVAGLFGVSFSADPVATAATVVPNAAHPVIDGPAGVVTRYDGSGNLPGFFGGIADLGPHAGAVLATERRTVVAVIERGALEPGSGPVIFLSESNGFLDEGLGTAHLGDNVTLIRNVFAFAKGPCDDDADCDDGTFCNGPEACQAGECVDAPDPCADLDHCDETADACLACVVDAECDDANVCTDDACAGNECVYTPAPDGLPCPDALFCNGQEFCQAGACMDGADPCLDAAHCDEQADSCLTCISDAECNDANPCTQDACVNHECVNTALTDGTSCGDAEFCNGDEICQAGICTDGPDPCIDLAHCDDEADACLDCVSDAECDDANECTHDACTGGACVSGPVIDGTPCADAVFCNGDESCVSGVCSDNADPCLDLAHCDEDADRCLECIADSECDDAVVCTGDSCVDGQCSNPPLSDGAPCPDALFCNGAESCDGAGNCIAGGDPCTDPCQSCDEDAGTCRWCIFDLDSNGVIGTGDFAFFAACFGACYAPDDPCGRADFDDDSMNCVGSGDFSALSSCFGFFCADCPACSGPGDAGRSPALGDPRGASFRLVASAVPSAPDTAAAPPPSERSFNVGQTFYLEVWAQAQSGTADGLASAYADLVYDSRVLVIDDIVPSELFSTLHRGHVDSENGLIRSVGGCVEPGQRWIGVDPLWGRVATLTARAVRSTTTTIALYLAESPLGVSVVGEFGLVEATQVAPGGVDLTIDPVGHGAHSPPPGADLAPHQSADGNGSTVNGR